MSKNLQIAFEVFNIAVFVEAPVLYADWLKSMRLNVLLVARVQVFITLERNTRLDTALYDARNSGFGFSFLSVGIITTSFSSYKTRKKNINKLKPLKFFLNLEF